MKPFNLDEALAGKPVLTRSGQKVSQITLIKDIDSAYPIMAVINKNIHYFNNAGSNPIKSDYDLFMVFEKISVWVNVYQNKKDIYLGQVYLTKKMAIETKAHTQDGPTYYIKTIEITNEP
jgi:hypothetical protein